jgi:hypothetical protein
MDGWGIHMSIRGGWVWNLWGRDCVVIHFEKGMLRIGIDDAENLTAFLDGKISEPGESQTSDSLPYGTLTVCWWASSGC